MRRRHSTSLAVLLAAGTLIHSADAKVWHITPDGSGDAATIQGGIDAAAVGDEVLVAAGMYTWNTQGGDHVGIPGPSLINMRSGVTLRSESGPEVTILDAEGYGRVIRCEATADVRIEGFTIQGGHAANPDGTGPGFYSKGVGGGILCRYGSAGVITNNVLRNNRALYLGGGIAVLDATPLVEGNVLCRNRADGSAGGISISGQGGNAIIRGNTIAENIGGGVACVASSATIAQNLLLSNLHTVSGSGGGWGAYCSHANVTFTCNNSWANEEGDNCVDGTGNISEDPLVCVTSAEYHLQPGSPCLPENNGCSVLIGARGVSCATTDVSEGRRHRTGVWVAVSPNPFNPQTRITYALPPSVERVQLTVYDLRGRRVARLVDRHESGTTGSVIWNGRDDRGGLAATGVYIVRVNLGSDATSAKLVLAK